MNIKKRAVTFLLKILPKQASLYLASKHLRFARNLPPGIVKDISYCGYEIQVDTTYPIERNLISGHYSKHLDKVLQLLLRKGDVAMDVGANVGAISLRMLQIVDKSGFVHCVEPGPLTADKLQATIEKNKIKNVACHRVGLDKSVGNLQWKLDRGNLGNAFLVEEGGDMVVEVTTLDNLVSSHSIDRLALIKIDVEGMELQVLQGSTEVLRRLKPTLILETLLWLRKKMRERGDDYFERLESLLLNSGYRLFSFSNNNGYPQTTMENTTEDTLAIHSSNFAHLQAIGADSPTLTR